MAECRTLSYEDEDLGSSYQSDTYDQDISDHTLKIIKYINDNNKSYMLEIGKNKLGAGSFGKVYDGVLQKKGKEKIRVAIKIIRIDEKDSKSHNAKEVSILNKINAIKNSKNKRISPSVYICEFLCSKKFKTKDKCLGYQVIVMDLKKPFNNSFFKQRNLKTLESMLVKALDNYRLAINKGIYLFDIKPRNNVVDDDNNVYIIDTDPSFIYSDKDFQDSFFQQMSSSVFKLIFLTLIQLVYIMRYLAIIKKVFGPRGLNDFLMMINNNSNITKIINRYIKYLEVIYRFLNYTGFEHKKDRRMRNLFFKYSITELYGNIDPSKYAERFNSKIMDFFNLEFDTESNTKNTRSRFRNLRSSTYRRTSKNNRMNVYIKRGKNTKKVSISSSFSNTL